MSQKTTRQYGYDSRIQVNLFDVSPKQLFSCYKHAEARLTRAYCRDYIDLAILHSGGTANVIQHTGDGIPFYHHEVDKIYPVFNKVRHYCGDKDQRTGEFVNTRCNLDKIDTIIWPLNRHRHFGPPCYVPEFDSLWEEKMPRAYWRGGLQQNDKSWPFSEDNSSSNEIKRWRLVSQHIDSSAVDAKFVKKKKSFERLTNSYLTSTLEIMLR